jgi:hypothetical protein
VQSKGVIISVNAVLQLVKWDFAEATLNANSDEFGDVTKLRKAGFDGQVCPSHLCSTRPMAFTIILHTMNLLLSMKRCLFDRALYMLQQVEDY